MPTKRLPTKAAIAWLKQVALPEIDRLESAAKEGPCLDSIEQDSVQLATDIARSTPWPLSP